MLTRIECTRSWIWSPLDIQYSLSFQFHLVISKWKIYSNEKGESWQNNCKKNQSLAAAATPKKKKENNNDNNLHGVLLHKKSKMPRKNSSSTCTVQIPNWAQVPGMVFPFYFRFKQEKDTVCHLLALPKDISAMVSVSIFRAVTIEYCMQLDH